MATRQYRPSRLRRLAAPATAILFFSYFAFHAFHGEYGMVGRAQMEQRAAQLGETLDRLKVERVELEARTGLLRPHSLDQDLVDERARAVLSMVHPNDIVLMRGHAVALQNN